MSCGSPAEESQLEDLRKEACTTGEMIKLNQEKLPGCYLHRTAVNDVARVEDRTFICSRKEEDAGPTNHWMTPKRLTRCSMTSPGGQLQGPHDVCHPVFHGPCRLPLLQGWR